MKKNEEKFYNADYQRITELKKYFGFHTWVEFAKNIGLGHAQIFSDIKKNSCGISDSLAKRIVEYSPNISYEWLKTGNGDMIVSGDGNNVKQVGDNNRSNITTVDDRVVRLFEEATAERMKLHAERERLLNIIESLTTK